MVETSKKNKVYTIYDIAKISGYSPKTVSRVINGEKSVRESTRVKIENIMKEVSFSPNIYAKNLSRKASVNLLISVKKEDAFPLIWFQTLLDKLLIQCKEQGVSALVEYFGDSDDINDSLITRSGSMIDGVIIFYEKENDARINYLKKAGVPYIIFGEPIDQDSYFVNNDDFNALYSLMERLSKKSYKTIWMLMGGKSPINAQRVHGAKKYIENHPESKMKLSVFYGLATIESVHHFISSKLVSNINVPDVIFVSGDEKVQGLFAACNELGLRIPNDLAVVGYDDIPISKYYIPSLSTISPDYYELSKQMVSILLKMSKGEKGSSIKVPTTYIERETTNTFY